MTPAPDVEMIVVDPNGGGPWAKPMPFRTVECCRRYLVCTVMPVGRCGICGGRPW